MSSEIAPIQPMRLGIVGCGAACRIYGKTMRRISGMQVTALMDADIVSVRAWARELAGPAVYTDYDAFLATAPLDAVLIASSVPARAAQAVAAARAGKHILCEGPLAYTLEECDAMLRAAQHKVLLMTAFPRRFDGNFRQVTRLIEEGRLGELSQVRCDWNFPAGANEQPDSRRTWGDAFQDHASQTIDLCRWWLGDVQTVSADVGVARMDLAVLGAPRQTSDRADLILNHARGVSIHHFSRAAHKGWTELYLLDGTEGRLEIRLRSGRNGDSSDQVRLMMHRPGHVAEEISFCDPAAPEEETRAQDRCARALEHFVDCIRAGTEPDVTGLDGRKAVEVLNAAYLSTLEKTKISLPLARSTWLE